ncbi:MAG TPA: GNAT family N-acetyltransferase [Bryobacteraceae bacterium]|nr:GNAT family N-acetyltransferase [Bryobacteraceae bacterium]
MFRSVTMLNMLEIRIRPAQMPDCGELAHLREALWPESSSEEHAHELSSILSGSSQVTMPYLVLIAEANDHALVGFLEAGLRSHADGCNTSHAVGFIEGWYVADSHRRQGIGKKLLAAAEDWARRLGCLEMASDTWIDNEISQRAHEALGYEVVDRCVHYRKPL